MYKYNSINHTNEKTEAFYCLKNNYDKEKTKYYTSSVYDNRNHIIVFSQYFRYRRDVYMRQPLSASLGDFGFDYSYIMAATADRVPCVFIENGQVAN